MKINEYREASNLTFLSRVIEMPTVPELPQQPWVTQVEVGRARVRMQSFEAGEERLP
jgi:hypothetical protein